MSEHDQPEHYERRRLDLMAAWFPGDPTHEPDTQRCPCGELLGVVKDDKGIEWFACTTEHAAIAAGTAS